jgi:hypothetical protein
MSSQYELKHAKPDSLSQNIWKQYTRHLQGIRWKPVSQGGQTVCLRRDTAKLSRPHKRPQ